MLDSTSTNGHSRKYSISKFKPVVINFDLESSLSAVTTMVGMKNRSTLNTVVVMYNLEFETPCRSFKD